MRPGREWGDPSLDLVTAFGEVEKQVLEARQDQTAPNRSFETARTSGTKMSKTRTAVPRTGLRPERLALKASQAAKELAKQQAQLETSMAAMSKNKDTEGGGKDSGKERTSKQKKAEQFFDKWRHSIEKKRQEKNHRSEW